MSRRPASPWFLLTPFLVVAGAVAGLEGWSIHVGRRPSVVRLEIADILDPITALDESWSGRADSLGPLHRAALATRGEDSPAVTLDKLREALAIEGANAELLADVGLAALRAGRLEDAAQALDSSIALNDRIPAAFVTLGRVHERAGRLEEAAAAFERGLALHSNLQSAALGLGRVQLARGQVAAAIPVLDHAVEISGGVRKARALLIAGEAYLQAEDPGKAAGLFRRATEIRPDRPALWLQLGIAESRLADREGPAAAAFTNALALDTFHPGAHFHLGRLERRRGRDGEALRHLRAAVAADPFLRDARRTLAEVLEATGDPEGARAQYDWLVRNEQGTAQSLATQGRMALQDGDLEHARTFFEQARASDPTEPDHWVGLGRVLQQQEELLAACELFEEFAQRFPADGRGAAAMTRITLGLGRYDDALASSELLIARAAERAETWFLRGRVLSVTDRGDEAIVAYRRAVSLRPGDKEALLNLAVLEQKRGREDRAIASYRELLAAHPRYVPAAFNLGLALSRSDDDSEAAKLYRQILETEPTHPGARLNLAVLLRKVGSSREAAEILSDGLLRDPGHVPFRYNLALLHEEQGRDEAALEEIERITLLDPSFVKAWKTLGRFSEAAGDCAAARHAYDRALELDPDSRMARRGLDRCAATVVGSAEPPNR